MSLFREVGLAPKLASRQAPTWPLRGRPVGLILDTISRLASRLVVDSDSLEFSTATVDSLC